MLSVLEEPLVVNVLGVCIDRGTTDDVLQEISDGALYGLRPPWIVSLVNAFSLIEAHRNPAHMTALRESDMCLADGIGVAWMARTPRIAGADLMLAAARHPELGRMRHVLLGGFGVAYRAALRQWAEAGVTPYCKPFIPEVTLDGDIVDWANGTPCDILWVALGCPRQELWMHANRDRLKANVVIGVGVAFDFLAGRVRRAPVWVQKIGMEWAWRIWAEPVRWRRQVAAVIGFLRLIARGR